MADPQERGRARRERQQTLLLEAYRRLGDAPSEVMFAGRLASEIGWEQSEFIEVGSELVDEGLLVFPTTGPTIDLTPYGREEAEQRILGGRVGDLTDRAIVTKRQAERMALLDFAYRRADGDIHTRFNYRDAASLFESGSEQKAATTAQWLVDQGLLDWAAIGGSLHLTRERVAEVERSEAEPDRVEVQGMATFNTYTVIMNSPGSAVAAHSPGATATAAQGWDASSVLALVEDSFMMPDR